MVKAKRIINLQRVSLPSMEVWILYTALPGHLSSSSFKWKIFIRKAGTTTKGEWFLGGCFILKVIWHANALGVSGWEIGHEIYHSDSYNLEFNGVYF